MEKLTIYKNKGETFRCHFKIDGASPKDTFVRLCLEFDDNANYFFNGTLQESGECVIEIPKLKNVDDRYGKLVVEAIADSIYFKVYEAEVELKNSVEVSMQRPNVVKSRPAAKVELENIQQAQTVVEKPEPVKERPWAKLVKEEVKPEPVKEQGGLSKFVNYLKNKK